MKKIVLFLIFCSFMVAASNLQKTLDVGVKENVASAKSQVKVNKIASQKQNLLEEYRFLTKKKRSLQEYNAELKKIALSQEEEIGLLNQQIKDSFVTRQGILPLLRKKLNFLDELVKNDTPFLIEERMQRVDKLKELISRSDVSISEKYRSIVEAYEIESSFANTIETQTGVLDLNSKSIGVDYLRIGRVAYYYVTKDRDEAAIWNNSERSWTVLSDRYILKLNEALKIASKKQVPALLHLPLFQPKSSQ